MVGIESGRENGRRSTRFDAQWLTNLLLIVAAAALPVRYAVAGIFWPSVWVDKQATVDGVAVQGYAVSLQDAAWIQRVEAATPGVLLIVAVGVPGFVLMRRLILDPLRADEVFTDELVDRRHRAARWCAVGALVSVASLAVCDWLIGRSLGASVSLSRDMLYLLIAVIMIGLVSSGLGRHGRDLRAELDQVI